MADFNPNDYETVDERIKRFYGDHPEGRIITKDVTTQEDRAVSMWRVKAFIYFSPEEQATKLPKATGFAFEVDGRGMTQKANALETCETSAIGRALANAGYSGNKRASREEMQKSARQGDTAAAVQRNRERPLERRAAPTEPDQAAIQALITKVKGEVADGTIGDMSLARKQWLVVRGIGASVEQLDDLAQTFSGLPDPAKQPA